MRGFFAGLKFFWRKHTAVRIVAAGVLGTATLGAAGAGIYTLMHDDIPQEEEVVVEEVEVEEEAAAEDVYIPEFKKIVLTSESLEKDLTIYISDEEDNAITGVPFSVKLLSEEKAKDLQSYIDKIDEINTKISEMSGESAQQGTLLETLQNRNVDITVTDENGEVVEKQKSKIKDDPLYQLYLDKEEAIQSFGMALKDADGKVYTDDDEDGVIAEKELEPGDYVACVMYDFDNQPLYDSTSLATQVNVKKKVEYKVQKEITKQIKKDVATEDNQPKEVTPVEETLKDTQEYVPSSKAENGSAVKSISGADITAPKSTASASKATKKDGAKTSVTHEVKVAAKEHKITVKDIYYDA